MIAVRVALCGLVWSLAAPLGAQPAPLRVLNWYDYFAPGVLEAFTAETGIPVVVQEYDVGDVAEAMLLARGSGVDLAIISSEALGRMIGAGALQPLSAAALPPKSQLDAAILQRLEPLDPGHGFAWPYASGTLGIGYNARDLAERLPDLTPDSWSLAFDPEIVAQMADCGVAFVDSVEEVVGAALLWRGVDPNTRSEAQEQAALADLAAVAPHVMAYTGAFYEPLTRGEFCLVVGWSGDILAAGADGNPDLRYVVPREGGLFWSDVFVVPVDAAQADSAHQLIAYLSRPSVAATSANYVWGLTPVRAARPLMDPVIRNHTAAWLNPLTWGRLVTLRSVSKPRKAALLSAWTQQRVGPLIEVCVNDCREAPRKP